MIRFGVIFLLIIFMHATAPVILSGAKNLSYTLPAKAFLGFGKSDKADDFNKVESMSYSRKHVFDIDSQAKRTEADRVLDKLIQEQLGEKYRRANSHDLYPIELPEKLAKKLDYKGQIDMMQFFNYSRKDLEHISGGKLLNFYKFNFDGDKEDTKDYAVIVWDTKKERPYLAIINEERKLYLEDLEATYLEPFNDGRFPSEVICKDDERKFINNPGLRVVAFEDKSYVLYFDAEERDWEKLYLD